MAEFKRIEVTDPAHADVLNEKIVEPAIELAQKVNNHAEDIAAVDQKVNAHLAESATGAHKAKNIAVEDANNRFTGTDVESVLNELFTFANNGKTDWANVIGSPLLPTDTFAQMKSKTQTLKDTLATNLTNKGQTASGTETLQSLINKVANISTGKKWAAGSGFGSGFGNGSSFTVSGLSFRPGAALIRLRDVERVYTGFFSEVGSYVSNSVGSNTFLASSDGYMLSPITASFGTSNFTLNSSSGYFAPSSRVDWFAIEY